MSMNQSRQFSAALLQRAELQSGIFTKRQLISARSSDSVLARAISDGACHRVEPGLFSLQPLLTARAKLWAGLLLGGPEARLGGDATRFALSKGPPPETIDIWTGRSSRRDRGCWRFHTGYPPPDPDTDGDEPENALGILLTTRALNPGQISQHAERQLDLQTRQLMLNLVDETCTEGSSVLESRWCSHVEGPHGLPHVTWTRLNGSGQRIVGVFDLADVRITLQPCRPSVRGGSMWQRWEADVSKNPASIRLGDLITVSLHWNDVLEQPCEVAEEVSEALTEAGSRHVALACSGCPRMTRQPAWSDGPTVDSCPTCGSRPAYLWTPQHLTRSPSITERLRHRRADRLEGG